MKIYHNLPALTANNALNRTQSGMQRSIGRLSTGLRINGASDDAAGLAVSEKMRAQIRGLNQAARNTQDGISMIQTAEGALSEVHSMLQRMRELSVQAANDTLTAQDRGYIQKEIDQLKNAIDQIAQTTQFNRKKLLDGSADALWSSDRLSTKAIVRGGVEREGNYKIVINVSDTGQAEIRKSNVFTVNSKTGAISGWNYSTAELKITHSQVFLNENPAIAAQGGSCAHIAISGISGGAMAGNYHISFPNQLLQAEAKIVSAFGMAKSDISINPQFPAGTPNANILFEAVAIHNAEKAVTFRAVSKRFDSMGNSLPDIEQFVTIAQEGIVGGELGNGLITANADGSYSVSSFNELGIDMQPDALKLNKPYSDFAIGDKFLFNVAAPDTVNPGNPGIPMDIQNPSGDSLRYNMSSALNGSVSGVHIPYVSLDSTNGNVAVGDIVVDFFNLGTQSFPHLPTYDFTVDGSGTDNTVTTSIDTTIEMVSHIFQTSGFSPKTLAEDRAFYDASGQFILRAPQELVLRQGDGQTVSVFLYGNETFSDLAKKLNDAVAFGLGQAANSNAADKFVTLADGAPGTSESAWAQIPNPGQQSELLTKSTLLVRSSIPGEAGRIYFSGDEDLLKALGLNTVQEAKESEFIVSVYDAHSGKTIVGGVKVTGNAMMGVVDKNIDVTFDPLAGMDVVWNELSKRFDLRAKNTGYGTYLHLARNTTVLQTGANEKEDLTLSFGDTRSSALRIQNVSVTDRTLASRAIKTLDAAINRVSQQRARLGADQNRLEHTASNISIAAVNLTASESRIRDADMAQEMLNFTKLSILSQSGTSMLAQANQLPQTILSLMNR